MAPTEEESPPPPHPSEADRASPAQLPAVEERGGAAPPVVGIGASAGGIAALKALFEHVPADSGLAWVVVVHLPPEHESCLAELLQPHATMPVRQVAGTVKLDVNHAYVIPPGANLDAIDTHLRLSRLEEQRWERAPIDHFFRTLARTHDSHAVAVVLTGTGSDGALGVREVKAQGGLTVVQEPTEAAFDGMPRAAIATGMVDLVLPLAEIPGAALRFARTEPRVPMAHEAEAARDEEELVLRTLAQLRARIGRDFSRYKRSTILRRIARRMQLRQTEELAAYLALLQEEPEEVRALADDLLIAITSFFRDPGVFEALAREVVPRLFERKEERDEIRVWSVGCATGEEAYSLAILLLEEAARREVLPHLRIFATDLHEGSIERARAGFYPGDIAADVSDERLGRFFERENGGYRVRKRVRELVVFAPHDLLGDPPFSKLDLVACRNVLNHLQRDVQRDAAELFHYALRPQGFLVLGTSESVDDAGLFDVVDQRASVYWRRSVPRSELHLPVFPHSRLRFPALSNRLQEGAEPETQRRLYQQMLEAFGPPSLLVSPDDRVVYLSAQAGPYLVYPGGELTASVVKLVREELRIELWATLYAARRHGTPMRSKPVEVEGRSFVVHVQPAPDGPEEGGYALILLDEQPPAGPEEPTRVAERGGAAASDARVLDLTDDPDLKRERLQTIMEEYDTSQEEMRASNEELQSSNEELRSTLEELETSKEVLQSVNEELQTVNQETRHKVEELAQLAGDLQNLMAATDIATLFLDRELRILRFTPRIGELFNVRPADRGRPLSDLTHRLGYDELAGDAETVLKRLVPVEREVEDASGRWFLTRVLPYRSVEDRIAGVVLTFVDITQRKRNEEALRTSERRVRELARELTLAEQRERRRIAHVLHEDLQQRLVAARMVGSLHPDQVPSPERVAELQRMLNEAVEISRTLSHELSPPILRGTELADLLRWLAEQARQQYGLAVEVVVEEEARVSDEALRILLYQLLRELLLNIVKHAGASQARLFGECRAAEVRVRVEDDGSGFDPASLGQAAGIGLASVRERLELVGGRLDVESAPGAGTRITISIPTTLLPDAG